MLAVTKSKLSDSTYPMVTSELPFQNILAVDEKKTQGCTFNLNAHFAGNEYHE